MRIARFYNNVEDSDVLIEHNEGTLACHKVILKAGSIVLDKMLKAPMLEQQENRIRLCTFKASSVIICIKHIYQIKLEEVPEKVEELEDLIDLCNYLDLDLLKMQIDHKLFNLLIENGDDKYEMVNLFLMSMKYEMLNLMECTAAYLFNKKIGINDLNLEQYKCLRSIILSFEKKYPYSYSRSSEIFNVVSNEVLKTDCEWANANNDKVAIFDFLSSYSFEDMKADFINEILNIDIIKSQSHLVTLFTTIINLKEMIPPPRNSYY